MDRFLCPRARLPTMQYPSTGEAMRRTHELHASKGVAGNASAFHTINDYSHVTSIVHAERNRKLSGLTSEVACSAWPVVPLLLSHHFGKENPLKNITEAKLQNVSFQLKQILTIHKHVQHIHTCGCMYVLHVCATHTCNHMLVFLTLWGFS